VWAMVRKIVALTEGRSVIMFDQLNTLIPSDCPSENIEGLLSGLSDKGIDLVDDEYGTSWPATPSAISSAPRVEASLTF
jgi:hypothetical protein